MRKRVFDRRIGPVSDLVELAAMKTVVEHCSEILRNAVHASCTDRFNARLLHRFEDRAGLLASRLQATMHGRDRDRQAQCDRIGMTANDGCLGLAELARRLRQPDFSAHQPRPLGRECDFEFRLARQSAQATGHCPLERFGRRFLRRRLGFDIRGHHVFSPLPARERGKDHDSATFTEDSGSSTPKQR